jgi:hypothetical protein
MLWREVRVEEDVQHCRSANQRHVIMAVEVAGGLETPSDCSTQSMEARRQLAGGGGGVLDSVDSR